MRERERGKNKDVNRYDWSIVVGRLQIKRAKTHFLSFLSIGCFFSFIALGLFLLSRKEKKDQISSMYQ
jgi:hypothetical protein